MKGFALRLVLKQRHKRTRKWPTTATVATTSSNYINCTIYSRQLHHLYQLNCVDYTIYTNQQVYENYGNSSYKNYGTELH